MNCLLDDVVKVVRDIHKSNYRKFVIFPSKESVGEHYGHFLLGNERSPYAASVSLIALALLL